MEKVTSKPRISLPVIVEGKYDKIKLTSIFSADVFTTEGFGIFNSKEKQAMLRRIAADRGVILLTDSDGGGRQIRAFLSGILPKDKINILYIPEIVGKERRKKHPSAAGLLGVEGVSAEVLRSVFRGFITEDHSDGRVSAGVTAADFFTLGLTGKDGSADLRDEVCRAIGMPSGMSAKALLAAVNLLLTPSEWALALENIGIVQATSGGGR